jgi:hypothetical protein
MLVSTLEAGGWSCYVAVQEVHHIAFIFKGCFPSCYIVCFKTTKDVDGVVSRISLREPHVPWLAHKALEVAVIPCGV